MTHQEIARLLAGADPGGLRARAGISVATVAGALGVYWSTVRKWERLERAPRGSRGAAYARFIAGLARHEAVAWDERRRAA